jgi:flagellar biosynthetic protein FliQ
VESLELATAAAQRALLVAMELSLPLLAVGMVVGFLVSVFQAVTQIQEQMLSFLPKILATGLVLFLLLPWLLSVITVYMQDMLTQLGSGRFF